MSGGSEAARLHAFASGMVQGVFYRRFVLHEAGKLGLSGTVKNLSDGRVEVIAEGGRELLDVLVARLREGPPGASVNEVALVWDEEPEGLAGFNIVHV